MKRVICKREPKLNTTYRSNPKNKSEFYVNGKPYDIDTFEYELEKLCKDVYKKYNLDEYSELSNSPEDVYKHYESYGAFYYELRTITKEAREEIHNNFVDYFGYDSFNEVPEFITKIFYEYVNSYF